GRQLDGNEIGKCPIAARALGYIHSPAGERRAARDDGGGAMRKAIVRRNVCAAVDVTRAGPAIDRCQIIVVERVETLGNAAIGQLRTERDSVGEEIGIGAGRQKYVRIMRAEVIAVELRVEIELKGTRTRRDVDAVGVEIRPALDDIADG